MHTMMLQMWPIAALQNRDINMNDTPKHSTGRIAMGLGIVVAIGLLSDLVLPANGTISNADANSGLGLFAAGVAGGMWPGRDS